MDTALVTHFEQLYLECLCTILQGHYASMTLREAHNEKVLLQDAATLAPDLIIMPLPRDLVRLRLVGKLRELTPRSKLMLIADHIPEMLIADVLRQGADALLSSQSGLKELYAAITEVEQNRRYVDPKLISFEQLRKTFEVAAKSLTSREQEVLVHLVHGLSNKLIAQEIVKDDGERITEQTVKTYVSNVLSKLQVTSRQEAIIVALQKGLVSMPQPWDNTLISE